ncbi:MAG: T9SS type A sorting domain-containing protein [Saprospiraceae bacterium]|nr:T9SS type A sorting domain-containing protein [Saprospiraceae bacterium]
MKKLLPIIALFGLSFQIAAQTVLYTQTFNGVSVPDLPGDWSATTDQIFTNSATPSSGYSGASGGNNLLSRNCNPNGEERSFQVDGISSVGYGTLTVSFGHRRTNAFTPAVALEWSSDGSSWNTIAYNSANAGTTWALFTSATLPEDAENQASLSFRWTYVTAVGNVPCDNFAGNYRIDDFKVTAGSVLPVELIRFAGYREQNTTRLIWQTATETSSDFFSVERSADGQRFAEIGRKRGAGTTYEPQSYTFTDETPLPGINYYRLRQVDFDGRFTHSKVVTVSYEQPASIHLFPSPAADRLALQLDKPLSEDAVWAMFDQSGRLVQRGVFASHQLLPDFDLTTLSAGFYTLQVIAGRDSFARKFQKQ